MLILAYLSMATTVLLPLLSAKQLYFSAKDTFIRLFIFNFILSGFAEILLSVFHFSRRNNMVVVNAFCLIQFVVLAFALLGAFAPARRIQRTASLLLIAVVLLLAVARYIRFIPLEQMDAVSIPLESILLFILSGINLVHVARTATGLILKDYRFWFTAACFLYFCISTVIFSTGSLLLSGKETLSAYTWVINSLLTIGTNSMYYIGIRCLPQTKN